MGADPLGLEILLLDAGLLVTLYAMWRIVRASRAAVAAMLPWAAVAVGLYGTGEGPFTMTVFTAADRIVAGPVDVSRRTCDARAATRRGRGDGNAQRGDEQAAVRGLARRPPGSVGHPRERRARRRRVLRATGPICSSRRSRSCCWSCTSAWPRCAGRRSGEGRDASAVPPTAWRPPPLDAAVSVCPP